MQNVFEILTTDQQTTVPSTGNSTPESKQLIEAKIEKQNNGIYGKRGGGGYGVSLKDKTKQHWLLFYFFKFFKL